MDDPRPRRFGTSPPLEWPPPRRRRGLILVGGIALLLFLSASATVSWYVDSLWFASLGYADVFWKTLNTQAMVFLAFGALTFILLYGAFAALGVRNPDLLPHRTLYINERPVTLSLGPVVSLAATVVAVVTAFASAAGLGSQWGTLALYWYGRGEAPQPLDPIFGRSLDFYLFTLPAIDLLLGWVTTLGVIVTGAAVFMATFSSRTTRAGSWPPGLAGPGVSISFASLMLIFAVRLYVSRFDKLFAGHTIFSGVTYTDAHVLIPGLTIVAGALVLGAIAAIVNAFGPRKILWLLAGPALALIAYVGMTVVAAYVGNFIVRPNQLVRERPYITHNIQATRQAFGLSQMVERAFPADVGIEAVDIDRNRDTLENIRLWDWRALQDTLRQIQEIRTYYDFPDIDIDRYVIGGRVRQVMLAARELSIEKLPESSRNWVNEKLIYTHGYGVTMNSVNGFTPEGQPDLILSNMPVQSTVPELKITRPEIYFGQLTDHDVYVRTRQKEFNYPQGESNSYTTYEGSGGIAIGSLPRRLLIAIDRGDLSKLPFSDDVTPESRLLMRRNIRELVTTVAPFLSYDPDPYIVVGEDGRLHWLMDGFTSSDRYPYATRFRLQADRVNYVRNSVKVAIDAYNGAATFYLFDDTDPIVNAYRKMFPELFRPASEMPAWLRAHVRYPELLLEAQAAAYGLYHMTNPDVFYNREDLWTVASEVTLDARREQVTQTIEPNFVLMKLPGEANLEFVEILPFTPANRNNMIGWIAGRSDGAAYGTALAFNFPKTRVVDGPLQIEARIDQNPQLSAQLSLWNQQGSRVRRGELLVIPIGRALLYAEPIYLQAERSPMPELRLVVLALQDRLAYGTSFSAAMGELFGERGQQAAAAVIAQAGAALAAPGGTPPKPTTSSAADALVDEAIRSLADYQRLTAEGKLGEAGQRLEALKGILEKMGKAP
jgi:uncharacterized membrane protein (UPF0182 family)